MLLMVKCSSVLALISLWSLATARWIRLLIPAGKSVLPDARGGEVTKQSTNRRGGEARIFHNARESFSTGLRAHAPDSVIHQEWLLGVWLSFIPEDREGAVIFFLRQSQHPQQM